MGFKSPPVVVANILCIAISLLLFVRRPQYDYIGFNYPMNLPVDLKATEMTFHDSIRYPISQNVSHGMWIARLLSRDGYVQLGSNYRAFSAAMWHELHCFRIIYLLLDDPMDSSFGGEQHLQHCLNYLRQYILCNADDTLELGDYHIEPTPPFSRQCLDWARMYDFKELVVEEFRESYMVKETP